MFRKNIVITGANAGIGLETAKGLYADGHNIIFGCRSQHNSMEALRVIVNSSPLSLGTVKYFKLDLSIKDSIEQFSKEVNKQFGKIHILINNAGVLMEERLLNQKGIEMTMAVNYFGHFYLTCLLFPNIKNSQQARIINLSSRLHRNVDVCTYSDLDCQNRYSEMQQYKKSHLAKVQFTYGLAQRLGESSHIKVVSLHPGFVCNLIKAEVCAKSSLYLARVQFQLLQSGQFYNSDGKPTSMNSLGMDVEQIDKLWKVSEQVFGIQFKI